MVRYEDECVECPAGMPCLGSTCPYKRVKHIYCDKCGSEEDVLYVLDGQELCIECLAENFDKVTLEDD